MAVLHKDPNAAKDKKSFFQECLDPQQLTAIKSAAASITIFRPIPEIDEHGNVMPMIRSMTAAGPDFSNIVTEEVVINTGVSTKFSGLCRASDSDATDAINMVFSSLYIKLKSKEKRGELPQELEAKIKGLLEEKLASATSKIKNRLLQRSQTIGFMQGIALTVNGKALDRPAVKQALVLSSSLCANLGNLLQEQSKKGIDIFDPKTGYAIIVKGLPPDAAVGRTVTIFTAELGKQIAIPEARARELWVPWEKAFKRQTTDQQIATAIRCYGADVVSVIYPDDVARLTAGSRPVVVQAPAQQQARPAAKAPVATATAGPEELDLSGATAGPVDDGDAGEEHPEAQIDVPAVAPASAATLASGYADLLKNI